MSLDLIVAGKDREPHEIVKALLGEKNASGVRRLVLDITVGDIVTVLVERFADRGRVAAAALACKGLAGRVEIREVVLDALEIDDTTPTPAIRYVPGLEKEA